MATVDLEQIDKEYPNGFHAVKDLELDVGEGEFMVLVGPSDYGKTIVLRMVAGLEDMTSGIEVKMDNKLTFAVNADRMQFFDPDTEKAIWT